MDRIHSAPVRMDGRPKHDYFLVTATSKDTLARVPKVIPLATATCFPLNIWLAYYNGLPGGMTFQLKPGVTGQNMEEN